MRPHVNHSAIAASSDMHRPTCETKIRKQLKSGDNITLYVLNENQLNYCIAYIYTGLGRVLDKSTRVQVLERMTSTSTSTSTGFSKVLEYKYF